MQCTDCRNPLVAGLYVRRKWTCGPFPIRCTRCGAVHATRNGEAERIGPGVIPVHPQMRLAPWRPHHTRPTMVGIYHCRFAELEPRYLNLFWDGRNFSHSGMPVGMRTFMGWRGSYDV